MSTENQLSIYKSELQEVLDTSKALDRLLNNNDFKRIIVDGFMLRDAARFVQLSVDHQIEEDQRKDSLATAQAAGYLKKYLHFIGVMGRQAENQIKQTDTELESIRNESGTGV